MKKNSVRLFLLSSFVILSFLKLSGQITIDSIIPVRGFCIAAPRPAGLDSFLTFINKELASRKVNTLILRVDYNYQYEQRPELKDTAALSKGDIKKIVKACKKNNIRLIPQVNLLGHQSWANHVGKLLQAYPDFDETPWVQNPEKYAWPNPDNLYCRSYCPLHPEIHKVVFDVMDEICDVFESNAFHAGMDEVFYLGEAKCPRCGGKDKAVLFADEVTTLRNHLAQKNRELWIWGDRLIDGKTTGLGMWEASYNSTYRAIDMIPKDVVICDWHYERADKSAVYFAMKGFNVITCPWRRPDVAVMQLNDMVNFRQSATKDMKDRYQGVIQTVWTSASAFLTGYYGQSSAPAADSNTQWNCFKTLFDEMNKLAVK